MKQQSRIVSRSLAVLAVCGFLCFLATEGPDYFGDTRPPGMPESLYPLFFPILMPLGFIIGFALLAFLWEVTKPTSEFGGLQRGLLPFALLSIGWGMFGLYHDLITDFWSVLFIPHLNEAEVYALIAPLFLLFRPSRKILVATLVYSVFALGVGSVGVYV